MITEIRHIIFSNDELKLVFQTVPLEGFDASRRILSIQVVEGPPPTVKLSSDLPTGGGREEIQVESYQLARLIVAYCREKRIPLPKDALKTLHAQGDQLCFSIMSSLS
ncbi:hypothetical protein FBZ89_12231 [Nitrospirillum amazonense]|uniref:Uncharacterized protein n=1 Tax=Nitrospirillum amazonense TaxID=28077 RepID=A0A560EU81_9PROT|nr:hypothetical protein [Nitrospirillum amazonense]TWB12931.1 hypothetical protein FBZ89_12231 [Nitrospirillum amazonense]